MAIDVDKIQKPLRKMGKLVRKMSGIPSLEDVHSVRTRTRQIEAAFSALGIDSNGRQRKLLDEMTKLRRRAGRVRDMDVLIGDSSSVHVENEEECAVELLEELGARRHRQAKRLGKLVRRNRKKFLRKLTSTSKRVGKELATVRSLNPSERR